MSSAYAARWDRLDPQRDGPTETCDLGWIGEDERGIWTRAHPEAALLDDDTLWGPWARYLDGHREPERSDYDRLSAFDYSALLTLAAAHGRQMRRDMEASRG